MKVKLNDFTKEFNSRKKEYNFAINKVLLSGSYILGEQVRSFEEEFAKYIGTKYCIGVANGLEALQISLMASGIGKGDEVITTPLSAVATTLAIMAVSAKPIFVDTDDNGQIDINQIPNKINNKTKAILSVDLYGISCDLNQLKKICKKNNLILIEDSAQAHGSVFGGKKLGSFGDAGCFSFYPTKNLGAFGDGGAIVTNDKNIATLSYRIRDYGQKNKYEHTIYGLNSRLDELHAAILRIKLKYLDIDNNKRQKIADIYSKELETINDIKILNYNKVEFANHHLFEIRVKDRNKLKNFLKSRDIQTGIHYPNLIPDQKFMRGLINKVKYPTARNLIKEILTLPCYPQLKPSEVIYVCKNIKEFYKSF